MKVAILVDEQYQVLEVWYPYLRLREEGVTPLFVGMEAGREYKSKEGYPAKADVSVKDVNEKDFDAVIVPGGWAPDFIRRNPEMNNFVKELFKKGKVVAGICHAGWVLASADVLRGRKATCFYAIKDDVINAGAKYVDEPVVVDGNLITSRNPYDLTQFVKEIIRALKNKK